jgi:hypothetical protein
VLHLSGLRVNRELGFRQRIADILTIHYNRAGRNNMRARPVGWLVILLLGIAPAKLRGLRSARQTGSPSEAEKCAIQGAVTQLPTRAPLKGAEVVLTAGSRYRPLYRTETDATGQFSLSEIEPGKYKIWIWKTGYRSPGRRCDSELVQGGDELTLISGQKLAGLKFQLLAPSVITGTVFDPSGDPVTDATVQAVRFHSYSGKVKLVSPTRGARTDDRGQFRLFHLTQGRYFLRVENAFEFRNRFEGHEDQTAKVVKGFLPIYYPNTTDLSQATLFDVHPGEELRGVDFTVHPATVLRIRGYAVNGLTGERISDATVAAEALPPAIQENRGGSVTLDQVDHVFIINDLVPGRYIVSIDGFVQPDRKRWGGWEEIDLTDSSLDDVQIKAFPGYDIIGRIQGVGGKKLDAHELQIILEPRGDLAYGHAFANARADGSFLLLDVKQDTYDIEVAGLPEGYYLKSARFGNVDAIEDGLRIVGESPSLPLVLEASPAAGEVDGIVQMANGKSACNGTVVLVPDANRRSVERYYQEAEVDHVGHFVLRGIAPGAYKLFAFDDAEEVGYRNPESLQPYENQGQPTEIGEGEHRTISLKLIPTGNKKP